jgi:hypothetical protein
MIRWPASSHRAAIESDLHTIAGKLRNQQERSGELHSVWLRDAAQIRAHGAVARHGGNHGAIVQMLERRSVRVCDAIDPLFFQPTGIGDPSACTAIISITTAARALACMASRDRLLPERMLKISRSKNGLASFVSIMI